MFPSIQFCAILIRHVKHLKLLSFQVTSICKIQGLKCIKQGRVGNALAWSLKAQDSGFITYIADQFLKQYAENGQLECRDLLENLGFCMMASDRLTFLGKLLQNVSSSIQCLMQY